MKAKLLSLALFAIMTTSAIAVLSPVHAYPYPANAFWITSTNAANGPNTIDGSTIGLNNWFLVYVWLNTTSQGTDKGINAWQFFMIYKSDLLNATDCEYTGNGKSLWSKNLAIVPVSAAFGAKNGSYNYVLFSEVLSSSKELVNSNSVAYVNFTIIKAPGKNENLVSDIRVDNRGAFKTQLKDAVPNTIIPTCYGAVYTWVGAASPKATILISPGTETFGGTAVPIPAGFEFTESVRANVDAGWGCINASFKLTNDNLTLLTITKTVPGVLWANSKMDNASTPGSPLVQVWGPSSTPSGLVILANITYRITSQGIQPHDYVADLTIDNSTGMVYMFGSPGVRIPVNTPLPTATITVKGIVVTPVGAHDVAVSKVKADRAWVYQGYSAKINVTVLDNGTSAENVNVTLYYNTTANKMIGTQNIPLSPGQNLTIVFVWKTTGVPYGHNYTITAVAKIPFDNSPADNTLDGVHIKVRIVGDVDGDGIVDVTDLTYEAKLMGSYPGSPRWDPQWGPACDINGDGLVDIMDIALVAKSFGKSGSP
jgi:hypothetical protein